ncbi:MAG: zinc-dependent alcohol dehydrogenase family protein [Actinomycetota bacterium]|nr:zinc-dependent alcohol dehydrogenase family protein [Actinomycetota bacterium]
MRAWVVKSPRPAEEGPLELVEREVQQPGPGEVRIRVSVCGVCRTDLHVAEGDLPPRRDEVVPGHEVIGIVDAVGEGTERFNSGDRIGIAWLRWTCGRCRFCRRGEENLCVEPRFTGWTDDGGYAEYAVAAEAYAYAMPEDFEDEQAAPLLCAGIVGYRALKRADLPPGGRLGMYGFGASAHIVGQVALSAGAELYVVTRSPGSQDLARRLGAVWVGGSGDRPPEKLDAAIVFAPAGDVVPEALEALDRGGTLAVAGIHLSDIPTLNYDRHLFHERNLRSVTTNTRADGEEFLRLAARIGVELTVNGYPFDHADRALADLAHSRFAGVAALRMTHG